MVVSPETITELKTISLSDYWKPLQSGEWIYECHDTTSLPDHQVYECRRRVEGGNWLEVCDGLIQKAEKAGVLDRSWPYRALDWVTQPAQRKDWNIAWIVVEPPVDPIPVDLIMKEQDAMTTTIAFSRENGPNFIHGQLTRTAQIQGFEDVECPAGQFARCLRIKVALEARFPLMLTIDWTTYHWLSPEVGEVRRIQEFSGWFFVFWFGSTQELLLKSHQALPEPVESVRQSFWSRITVVLSRTFPRPRIAGMKVTLSSSQPSF